MDIRNVGPIFKNLSAEAQGNPDGEDLSRYVLSIDTHKSLSMSAGSWQVQLVPQPDGKFNVTSHESESFIYRSIKPMDVVLIGVEAPDENGIQGRQEFMIGFVDRVFKTKSSSGGQVQRGITVRGRDATKIFINDMVAMAPELATDKTVQEILGDRRTQFLDYIRGMSEDGQRNIFANSHIVEAMDWILKNIPAMRINIPYFGGLSEPGDIFMRALSQYGEDRIYNETLNMYAGAVSNYMQQIIDPAFYELWIDLLPTNSPSNTKRKPVPIVVLRPKPYDHKYEYDSEGNKLDMAGSYWSGLNALKCTLPFWENFTTPTGNHQSVPESEILNKSIGVSDEEVFTMFKLIGTRDPLAASETARFGMYFPLLDATLIKIYGLQELQTQSQAIPAPNDWARVRFGLRPEFITSSNFGIPELLDKEPLPEARTFQDVLDRIEQNDARRLNSSSVAHRMVAWKRDSIWRWMRYNHILESGLLTIKGRNCKVGTKITLPDEESKYATSESQFLGMEFYCVAVSQRYRFGTPWTTTLALTRGHNPSHLQEYHDFRRFGEAAGSGNGVFTATVPRHA